MRRAAAFAVILPLAACITACTSSPPASDDDVLKHVLAINTCNAKIYIKQADTALKQLKAFEASRNQTPGPTPPYDDRGLRLCYVATVPNQPLNPKLKTHPAILALGRACDHLIDTQSDEAMAKYETCIQDGMPAALKAGQDAKP